MSNDPHDDGLVHAHGWARDERPPHERPRAAAGAGSRTAPDAPRHHHVPAPDHDDGLVHDHAWARSERLSAYAAE
jgi:hypothetical protein